MQAISTVPLRRAALAALLAAMLGSATARGAKITEFSLTSGSNPEGITTGPDGRLWFCEEQADKVGALTTDGALTQYPISAGAECGGIVAAAGMLYFTEFGTGHIGYVTRAET
jgi:virginiamycin B lyase